MKTTVYKPGGKTNVWGQLAHVKIIDSEELQQHLEDGWLDHPSKLFETTPEPDPGGDVVQETPKKRGRPPKGADRE